MGEGFGSLLSAFYKSPQRMEFLVRRRMKQCNIQYLLIKHQQKGW